MFVVGKDPRFDIFPHGHRTLFASAGKTNTLLHDAHVILPTGLIAVIVWQFGH